MYGYFIPTVNLMGAGALSEVGKQAKIISGTIALVVAGKVVVKTGIAEKVIKLLSPFCSSKAKYRLIFGYLGRKLGNFKLQVADNEMNDFLNGVVVP